MISETKVEGKNFGDVMLYTLSTCAWCKRTKKLLNELNVEYKYIDVDLQDETDQVAIENELEKFNPNLSYPTLIIDNEKSINGYDAFAIKGAFDK